MLNIEQILGNRFSILIIPLAIAVIFSSFTLIIIASMMMKFILFGFEVVLITVIFLLLTGEGFESRKISNILSLKKLRSKFKKFHKFIPGAVLVAMAAVLFFLLFYRIDGGIIQIFFAMASGCFLVGYSILSIIRVQNYFSKIEFYIVSFLTSIGITGFVSIGLNASAYVELGLSISFLAIGIISLLVTKVKNGKNEGGHQPSSLSKPIDAIALSVCIGFYLVSAVLMYPNAASFINSDISRHFSYSATLIRAPELYSQPNYLLFHSFQGSISLLSGENQPMILFNSSFIFLNIFLPLSVYVAAKRFLGLIDYRIPGIAVLFYTFLSNLSFIYFATLYFDSVPNEYSLIVREVAEKSYFGIINLLQPFNFLVPLTLSVIGVLIILSMLRNPSIPRYRYIGIFAFIIVLLCLIHVPEISIFAVIVSLYSILNRRIFARTKESLIAIATGFVVAAIVFTIIDISVFKRDLLVDDIYILSAFLLPVVASGIALVWDYKKIKLRFVTSRFQWAYVSNKLEGVTFAILVLYLTGIIFWFFTEDFKTSPLIGTGVVPIFMYPVILGVVGLLAILSIRNLRDRNYRCIVLFLGFTILFLFIMGKVLSYVNINFIQLPYWEKRMPGLMFIFASMLAAIPVINLWKRVRTKRSQEVSHLIISMVIASIILIGFSTLATQIEYWYVTSNGDLRLDIYDIDAFEVLRRITDEHPSSVTISPSEFSRHAATFSGSAYQLPRQNVLFSSELPQVPLMILGGLKYDRIYIYVHNRDLGILDAYSGGWFSKHLLPSLPILYRNEEVKIYNATGLKFPQPESDTAVAIPAKAVSDNWLYAYNAIAKSLNYTDVSDQDVYSFGKYSNIIISNDPVSPFSHYLDFTSNNVSQDFWKIAGHWEAKDDGLHRFGNYSKAAGDMDVLISDFATSSNSASLSTLFNFDDEVINRMTTTYVSFVYSWRNQANFEMAGVAFKDDNIYAYFGTVKDSKITFYPQFPYSAPLITGLKWDSDSMINMTLSKINGLEDLYINGTKYLSRTIADKSPGFVGISTFGPNEIVFKGFRVSIGANTYTPFEEYYDYVANGGNLTVYNTDGYGAIFRMLNGTINSDHERLIESIPGKVDDRGPDGHTTHSNLSSSPEVPGSSGPNFTIINKKIESGNIRYLDIYPLIKNQSTSEEEKALLLKNLTNMIVADDYERTNFDYRDIPMIFQNITAEGNVHMNTSFLEFRNNISAEIVDVRSTGGGQFYPKTNLKSLKLSEYNTTSISAQNITLLENGRGVYVDFILGKDQNITLNFDRNAHVLARTPNESQLDYKNVTSITLKSSQPVYISTRTPFIDLDGSVRFGNLYAGRMTGIAGGEGTFNGEISFVVLASDTYTLVDNVSHRGKFEKTTQMYNEFSALSTSTFVFDIFSLPPIVILILTIPIALAAVFFFYKKIF